MMFTVYILQSEQDNSYYIGSTSDLENRLLEHNYESTGYTSKKRPWKLIYTEEYDVKSEALIRERQLKKMKSRKYIDKLITMDP